MFPSVGPISRYRWGCATGAELDDDRTDSIDRGKFHAPRMYRAAASALSVAASAAAKARCCHVADTLSLPPPPSARTAFEAAPGCAVYAGHPALLPQPLMLKPGSILLSWISVGRHRSPLPLPPATTDSSLHAETSTNSSTVYLLPLRLTPACCCARG